MYLQRRRKSSNHCVYRTTEAQRYFAPIWWRNPATSIILLRRHHHLSIIPLCYTLATAPNTTSTRFTGALMTTRASIRASRGRPLSSALEKPGNEHVSNGTLGAGDRHTSAAAPGRTHSALSVGVRCAGAAVIWVGTETGTFDFTSKGH